MPLGALAAGLGKVTVLSPLGQPLRAEVDVTASREEMASMTAKVAPASAFQQAGIEYAPALAGIRVAVDKRPNGQPFLKVTSDRAINDPFLDLLLELTWSSGRMMREYTMLLDPPEALQKAAPIPVAAPEIKAPTVAQAPAKPVAAPAAVPAPVPAKAAPAEGVPAPAKPASEVGTHTVKRGETLSKIAGEAKPEGVSLDQMLVALFQANKDAFDGGNMNRLKTGKILSLPDQATASSVSAAEARKIVLSQSNDFNAYRQKLAGTVVAAPAVKETGVKQEAAGKITAKVEEKPAAAAPSKDKLEVSRTEAAKEAKAVQGRIAALEEDLVAREKALKEANSRIADLEKNLADLKKLAELKSQAAAQLQQQAQAAKAAPTPASAPAPAPEVKKPEPAPVAAAPVEIPKAPEKQAEAVAPVEPPKPVEAAPPPAPVEPPKPVEPPQAVELAKKPAPPPAEPSFIDDNAALVYGGGGVLVLLLGYLGYSAMRRKREGELSPTTSRITEGDLMANSVFGATGGQSVDTGASIQTDFSQSNLTSIDADEGVDPVAEADVYMAYGRDAQAEEILIDALKNDPTRHAIHLKLLEIYSGRKSAKQFESLAADLYGQTSGAGPDWEKAAAMGRELDPANPLYGAKPAEAEGDVGEAAHAAEDLVLPPSEVQKLRDTVTMPGQFGAMAAAATAAAEAEPLAPMDFDLELPQAAETATDIAAVPPSVPMKAPVDLNLDIGLPSMEGAEMDATAPMGVRMPEPASAKESGGLDFEFDLGIEGGDGIETVATSVSQPVPAMDLSSIDLNLSDTSTEPDVLASAAADQDDPDVATKIELAQAYEEMGDKEGARELLQEVIQEGSARQQEIARSKLALLGA